MDKHISEVKLILIIIILKTKLSKLIHGEVGLSKEWHKYLGGVAYSINTQQQSTLSYFSCLADTRTNVKRYIYLKIGQF